ncbi:hypothetical protein Tco_0420779 [Tanacetum coccineum]
MSSKEWILRAEYHSLKSLDPDYSSKNHVRKFLCSLPLKWRAKVTAIEEAKDLATLSFDELIGNLKVYEIVLDNDGVASKTTKKRSRTSESSSAKVIDSYTAINLVMVPIESQRRIRLFVGGAWSDSENGDEPQNGATCLMAFNSQEAYDGGDVVFGSNLKGKVVGGGNITHDFITITNVEHVSDPAFNLVSVTPICGIQGNANNRTRNEVSTSRVLELVHLDLFGPSQIQSYGVLNKETMRIKKSLNVTFDESLPEPKSSPSIEDDMINELIVQDLNGHRHYKLMFQMNAL